MKHLEAWIQVYGGLLGIFLGWILLQAAQWYQAKKQDNRVRKQVLFNLLEIYHLLLVTNTDVSSSLKLIYSEIATVFPGLDSNEKEKKEFYEIFSPLIYKIIKDRFNDDFQELELNYMDSIKQLSSVDPIISYSLSGQTNNIKQVSNAVTTMIMGILPHLPSPVELEMDSKVINQILEKRVFDQMMTDIRKNILALSMRINFFLKFKVSRLLKDMTDVDDNSKLRSFIRVILTDANKAFDTQNIINQHI